MKTFKKIVALLQCFVVLLAPLSLIVGGRNVFLNTMYSKTYKFGIIPLIFMVIALEIFGITVLTNKNIALYIGAGVSGLMLLISGAVTAVCSMGKVYYEYFDFIDLTVIAVVSIIIMIITVVARILQRFEKKRISDILAGVLIGISGVIGVIGTLIVNIPQAKEAFRVRGNTYFIDFFVEKVEKGGILKGLYDNIFMAEIYKIIAPVGLLVAVALMGISILIPDDKTASTTEEQ